MRRPPYIGSPNRPGKCGSFAGLCVSPNVAAAARRGQGIPRKGLECVEGSRPWYNIAFSTGIYTATDTHDPDDPNLPPIPTRLALVKLFIELSLFTPALLVLHGVMASDDQDVEAWYLEGWCFFLMSEHAKENGGKMDDLTWEELARDARDCLETCQVVSAYTSRSLSTVDLRSIFTQLHTNEGHPDMPLLDHVRELNEKLDALGISASPIADDEGDAVEWEDMDGSEDSDGDVEMS